MQRHQNSKASLVTPSGQTEYQLTQSAHRTLAGGGAVDVEEIGC